MHGPVDATFFPRLPTSRKGHVQKHVPHVFRRQRGLAIDFAHSGLVDQKSEEQSKLAGRPDKIVLPKQLGEPSAVRRAAAASSSGPASIVPSVRPIVCTSTPRSPTNSCAAFSSSTFDFGSRNKPSTMNRPKSDRLMNPPFARLASLAKSASLTRPEGLP